MKEAYFKYIFPKKKLGRRTKQKQKLNAQIKRNTLVLRTFKYENKDNRNLEEAHNLFQASEL